VLVEEKGRLETRRNLLIARLRMQVNLGLHLLYDLGAEFASLHISHVKAVI
jgi:hypothetical protein